MFFKNANSQEALGIEICEFIAIAHAKRSAGSMVIGLKKHLENGSHQGTSTVSKSSQALSAPLLNG